MNREQLGIIVQFEIEQSVSHRVSLPVDHPDCRARHGSIIGRHVDLRIAGCTGDNILRAVISAEYSRVHQHTARGRTVEPPEIQCRFRLAGTEKIPAAVCPGLHPGMIVVRMGPTRRIDLTGRNAHGPQRGNRKRGLLTTTARSRTHRGQRRRSAGVRGAVGHILVAPVVHFQHGIVHGKPGHPLSQLFIADRPEGIEVLVVDAHRQHEMPPFPFRDRSSPWQFPAGSQGGFHLAQIKFGSIIRHVRPGHIGIQKLQSLALFRSTRHRNGPVCIPAGPALQALRKFFTDSVRVTQRRRNSRHGEDTQKEQKHKCTVFHKADSKKN